MAMIPFYVAELRQIEILCIGLTLLMIRCIFTGETLSGSIPDTIKTPAWAFYFAFLWFVLFPYIGIKVGWPHYGIWGLLFGLSPWLCWIGIALALSLSSYFIYNRDHIK